MILGSVLPNGLSGRVRVKVTARYSWALPKELKNWNKTTTFAQIKSTEWAEVSLDPHAVYGVH